MYTMLSVRAFLTDKKIPIVAHPWSDPRVIFSFSQIFALKGHRSQDVEEIKANTAAGLKVLPSERFQRTFENWQERQYFGGDIFKQCVT